MKFNKVLYFFDVGIFSSLSESDLSKYLKKLFLSELSSVFSFMLPKIEKFSQRRGKTQILIVR